MPESPEHQIQKLLTSLGPSPGYAAVQRVGKKLISLCNSVAANAGDRQVRLLLASSFTIDQVAPALAVECSRAGLNPVIQVDGFNAFRPHMLDPLSSMYEFSPDMVFLAAELDSITPFASDGKDNQTELAEDAIRHLTELIAAFKRNCQALLVLHNFAAPVEFPFSLYRDPRSAVYNTVNAWLEKTCVEDPQVCVLDFDRLCSFHGKCRTTDPKLHYLGSIEVSESFLPAVVKAYMAYIQAARGVSRKCLVLDLDNTLWGGVLGEDGLEGIYLARHGTGSEYYDFQKAILALHDRGVVLAANSKNNLSDVQWVFRQHPDMLLREQHFACLQINWDDKAANLKRIAKELNLGLDSLVFVDDNPVERAWIKDAVPEVMVVDLPPDPSLYAHTLQQLTVFEVRKLTDEDRKRGDLYASERARRQLLEESQGIEGFLRSLKTVLTVSLAESRDIARIGQLTRKTNQFNMTSRRYSDAEIGQFVQSPKALVYTLRVRDAFGDSGLVGVVILKNSLQSGNIDTFLISCRVLGRRIEQAFMTEVLSDARQRGVRRLEAEFVTSPKNTPAADFYRSYGFANTAQEQGRQIWEFETHDWTPPTTDWFTVEWASHELEGVHQ